MIYEDLPATAVALEENGLGGSGARGLKDVVDYYVRGVWLCVDMFVFMNMYCVVVLHGCVYVCMYCVCVYCV